MCPICGRAGCVTYPLMLERFAAGRDVEHWTRIHDQLNGIAPSYPPLLEQLGNAAAAAGRLIGAAVTGQAVAVSQEEQDRRLAICGGCEQFDPQQGRCRKCGCVGRWKSQLATEQCPLGKW